MFVAGAEIGESSQSGIFFAFHDEAQLGSGFGQDAMVKDKQCKLQPVSDASFVIDGAEIVFDDLFGGLQPEGDLAIFATLHDECNDAHFLGGEALANADADGILGGRRSVFRTDGLADVSRCNGAQALQEQLAGRAAKKDTMQAQLKKGRSGFGIFCDDDATTAHGIQQERETRPLRVEF